MDDRGQYSTLELANYQWQKQHDRPPGHAELEAVLPSTLPQVSYDHDLPEAAVKSKGPGPQRILGLKRRTFIIVTLVALLILGAVVGGAVGGTVGKSKSTKTASISPSPTATGPSSSTPTPITTSDILSNSSLGSTNWTDSKGYSHHAVFYQGRSKSLFLSLWDSQNTTWAVKNVSASVNSTFAALLGSPLSCAVTSSPWPFQLNLYYLSLSNHILELYSDDQQGGDWSIGSLSTYNLKAGMGSQLASYWQRCDYQCSQEIILLYEDSAQKLTVANSSNWADTHQPIGIDINSGSGLALVPLAPLSDVNSQPYQLRAYVDVSETSQEWMWTGFAGQGDWYDGGLPNVPLSSTPPQFAAASFGTPSQGFYAIMLVFLFSNGTISANWFDNTNWHTNITPSPSMPQSNFTAIAMNLDLRFYGISAGSIYEYEIDGSNPFDWTYNNAVNTTFTSH